MGKTPLCSSKSLTQIDIARLKMLSSAHIENGRTKEPVSDGEELDVSPSKLLPQKHKTTQRLKQKEVLLPTQDFGEASPK